MFAEDIFINILHYFNVSEFTKIKLYNKTYKKYYYKHYLKVFPFLKPIIDYTNYLYIYNTTIETQIIKNRIVNLSFTLYKYNILYRFFFHKNPLIMYTSYAHLIHNKNDIFRVFNYFLYHKDIVYLIYIDNEPIFIDKYTTIKNIKKDTTIIIDAIKYNIRPFITQILSLKCDLYYKNKFLIIKYISILRNHLSKYINLNKLQNINFKQMDRGFRTKIKDTKFLYERCHGRTKHNIRCKRRIPFKYIKNYKYYCPHHSNQLDQSNQLEPIDKTILTPPSFLYNL
jgi:hypothetical protein